MEKFGLKPLPKDERDFKLGAIFDYPDPPELPDEFILPKPKVKHQGGSDFCTAFASCSVSEIQEGVELSPLYSFALSKEISGDVESWGQDLREAVRSHTKYGAIPEEKSEYKLSDVDKKDVRYIDRWKKDYSLIRPKFAKKSYFSVSGIYDHFDDIRASMWQFRANKQAVEIGLLWSWRLGDKFLTKNNEGSNKIGHAVAVLGWKTIDGVPLLVIQNSYGEGAGEGGLHYVSREVINEGVELFGAYMMVDLDQEKAQHMIDNGIRWKDNWFIAILKALNLLIKAIFTPDKPSSNKGKNKN